MLYLIAIKRPRGRTSNDLPSLGEYGAVARTDKRAALRLPRIGTTEMSAGWDEGRDSIIRVPDHPSAVFACERAPAIGVISLKSNLFGYARFKIAQIAGVGPLVSRLIFGRPEEIQSRGDTYGARYERHQGVDSAF